MKNTFTQEKIILRLACKPGLVLPNFRIWPRTIKTWPRQKLQHVLLDWAVLGTSHPGVVCSTEIFKRTPKRNQDPVLCTWLEISPHPKRYQFIHNTFYYMEKSVLLGIKPLVDSIRHFIRDPSGVFSVCHLCECRIVQ